MADLTVAVCDGISVPEMPNEGDQQRCPLCEEESRNGTWTWTRWEATAGPTTDDGQLIEGGWIEEWQCDVDPAHNRRANEP